MWVTSRLMQVEGVEFLGTMTSKQWRQLMCPTTSLQVFLAISILFYLFFGFVGHKVMDMSSYIFHHQGLVSITVYVLMYLMYLFVEWYQ